VIRSSRHGEVTRFELATSILGRGRYWTVAYRVGGILIDTGCENTKAEILAATADGGLDAIVNTHCHEDHIGANAVLVRRQPSLDLAAHPEALPVLADPAGLQPQELYRSLFWGMPEPSVGRPIADGEEIRSGPFRLRALWTPGHSTDSVCLFEPERGWLFTGDMYVGGRDRACREAFDVWTLVRSLRRLAELPATRLFPGCARVRDDPQAALVDKAAYFEEIGGRVLDLHRRGWTEGAIVGEVLGGPMFMEWFTGGGFTRRWMVRSFLKQKPGSMPSR
jgi:glyoxylase-like metal-dependent hydrolase (beta-lactamase superfamily II)